MPGSVSAAQRPELKAWLCAMRWCSVTGQIATLASARIRWLCAIVGWLTMARLMTTEAGVPALWAIRMVWWMARRSGAEGWTG